MWNEPKEGIKAIATNRIYGKATIDPVDNVVKVNRYCEKEKEQDDAKQSFSGLLKQEMKRKQEKPVASKQETLRLMGGLTQYDRYAREFCYILSRDTDYKA